jgi:hypothetical protein
LASKRYYVNLHKNEDGGGSDVREMLIFDGKVLTGGTGTGTGTFTTVITKPFSLLQLRCKEFNSSNLS